MIFDILRTHLKFYEKYYADGFQPVWSWIFPKEEVHFSYKGISRFCRGSQYFVTIVAILLILSFDHSRQLLVDSATIKEGLLITLVEFLPFAVIGYFLGSDRMPANYVSLALMKVFIVLERELHSEVNEYKTIVLQESQFIGSPKSLKYTPKSGVTPIETKIRSFGLMTVFVVITWLLTKYISVDVTIYEGTALIVATVATSTAALLLMSTFAFHEFPGFKAVHLRYCEVWIMLAICTYCFLIMYLVQQLGKSVKGKTRRNRKKMNLIWETVIFTCALYIMLCYMPVIHKGLCTREILEHKWKTIGHVAPPAFQKFASILTGYSYEIGKTITSAYGGHLN